MNIRNLQFLAENSSIMMGHLRGAFWVATHWFALIRNLCSLHIYNDSISYNALQRSEMGLWAIYYNLISGISPKFFHWQKFLRWIQACSVYSNMCYSNQFRMSYAIEWWSLYIPIGQSAIIFLLQTPNKWGDCRQFSIVVLNLNLYGFLMVYSRKMN